MKKLQIGLNLKYMGCVNTVTLELNVCPRKQTNRAILRSWQIKCFGSITDNCLKSNSFLCQDLAFNRTSNYICNDCKITSALCYMTIYVTSVTLKPFSFKSATADDASSVLSRKIMNQFPFGDLSIPIKLKIGILCKSIS